MRAVQQILYSVMVALYSGAAFAGPNVQPIPVPRPNVEISNAAPQVQEVVKPSAQVSIPIPKSRPGANAQIEIAPDMRGSQPIAQGDEALLQQISIAYSKVQSIRANFVQLSGENRSTGKLTLVKPGKFQFAYDPPSTINVISNGETVLVRDTKLRTNDSYLLSQTPLRVLLMSKIDLTKDVRVTSVIQRNEVVEVNIDESQSALQGQIKLYFSKRDFVLQQWNVTDGQGIETLIALTNIENNIPLDQNQFKVDFEAIRQEGGFKGN